LQGLVFKENSNQRYATNAATSFALNEIARRHAIAVQDFCVRNDAMCGSTVGPILAANCGVRCVDVGVPQVRRADIFSSAGDLLPVRRRTSPNMFAMSSVS
jgi:aspartyl aminopeptidase